MQASPPPLPASLHAMLDDAAAKRREAGRERSLIVSQPDGIEIIQHGRHYVNMASNDYLGIAASLREEAAGDAHFIAGAGASRLLTGNHSGYEILEGTLAAMKGSESALVVGSGYLANLGAIPALAGRGDLILADKLAHACMLDGARLSGAKLMRFRHNDMTHLQALLAGHRHTYRHCLILTETIFSMDGDRAPLSRLGELAATHDAWLVTDDAHGLGLPQPEPNPAPVQIGTLSKAVGAYGGYICGSRLLIDHLINQMRPAIFSTALPESVTNAALRGLRLMQAEKQRATRVMGYAHEVAEALNLPPPASPILPVILSDAERLAQAQHSLKEAGILTAAIRPPTVPPGTERLRISLSAAHTPQHIARLKEALGHLRGQR